MPVYRLRERRRLRLRQVETRGRDEQHGIALQLQVHRVGAQPRVLARFQAAGERGERTCGQGRLAKAERAREPARRRKRLVVRPAPAREQPFQRRVAGIAACREQPRRHDLDVHQPSSTRRAPPPARLPAR